MIRSKKTVNVECETTEESINHVICKCIKLVRKEYKCKAWLVWNKDPLGKLQEVWNKDDRGSMITCHTQ